MDRVENVVGIVRLAMARLGINDRDEEIEREIAEEQYRLHVNGSEGFEALLSDVVGRLAKSGISGTR